MRDNNLTAIIGRGWPTHWFEGDGETRVCVEKARRGDCCTASVQVGGKKFFIHSLFDPEKEGAQMAEAYLTEIESGEDVLMYGFGLGYHIESLMSRDDWAGRLFVVDANREMLATAIDTRNMVSLFCNPRFTLISGSPEEINGRIKEITEDDDVRILIHSQSLKTAPSYAIDTIQIFEYIHAVNQIAKRRPMDDIVTANISEYTSQGFRLSRGISVLAEMVDCSDAIIVGTGPSIDYNVRYLRDVADRALIVACDSALPVLRKARVRPHIAITLDPQGKAASFFEADTDAGFLVHSAGSPVNVVAKYPELRRFVAVAAQDYSNPVLAAAYSEKDVFEKCPNVLLMGLDFLSRAGVRRVFLAGSDLAVERKTGYSLMSGVENPQYEWDALRVVPGFFGPEVRTLLPLLIFHRTLEEFISANEQMKFFNATEGGAVIEGARPVAMKEVVYRMIGSDGVVFTATGT